jgi:lipopolysaccharide transport system permease protein
VFAYAGLLGWNAFNTSFNRTTSSLLANAALVAKVYFPRLVLPASTLLATLFDFVVGLSVMVVLLVVYGVPISARLLLVPFWLCLLLGLSLGLGLAMGGLSVRYRDIGLLTPVATQMLLYISPVAYALDEVPEAYRGLYSLNPLVGMLEGLRWSLLGGDGVRTPAFVAAIVGPVVALIVGMYVFRRQERSFADVI